MSDTIQIVDTHGNPQAVPIEKAVFVGDDSKQARELAKSDAGQQAAASAVTELITDFVTTGGATPIMAENAARVLGELAAPAQKARIGQAAPEIVVPASAAVEPEPEPERAPEPAAVAIPEDYELPPDLAAELEADDVPDEVDDEPAAVVEEEIGWDDDDPDPRVDALRKQLEQERKARVKAEQQRVQAARPSWEAEAKRVFRLGTIDLLTDEDVKGIKADSKRSFLRQAKALADQNKRVVQRFAPQVAPAAQPEPVDAEAELRARIRAEEEERAKQRWGKPHVGGPAVEATPIDVQRRLDRARRTGNLHEIVKARLFG